MKSKQLLRIRRRKPLQIRLDSGSRRLPGRATPALTRAGQGLFQGEQLCVEKDGRE